MGEEPLRCSSVAMYIEFNFTQIFTKLVRSTGELQKLWLR